MDIDALISQRVRDLRKASGLTLEQLSTQSGVSRSMISLIERQETSPTATVLDKLANALGVTLQSLFQPTNDAAAPQPVVRHDSQAVWTDPESGYVRRQLSPPAYPSPLELVEVQFPPGKTVAFDTASRSQTTHQQVWVLQGAMRITVGDQLWTLQAGDCLAMELGQHIVFHNPGPADARYVLALSTATPRRNP